VIAAGLDRAPPARFLACGEESKRGAGMAGKAMPCPPLLPRGPIGAVLSLVVKEILGSFWPSR